MGKDFNLSKGMDMAPPPPDYTSESVFPPVTEIREEAPHRPSFEEQYPEWRIANDDDLAGDHTWQEQTNAQNEAIETDAALNEPGYADHSDPPKQTENNDLGEDYNSEFTENTDDGTTGNNNTNEDTGIDFNNDDSGKETEPVTDTKPEPTSEPEQSVPEAPMESETPADIPVGDAWN